MTDLRARGRGAPEPPLRRRAPRPPHHQAAEAPRPDQPHQGRDPPAEAEDRGPAALRQNRARLFLRRLPAPREDPAPPPAPLPIRRPGGQRRPRQSEHGRRASPAPEAAATEPARLRARRQWHLRQNRACRQAPIVDSKSTSISPLRRRTDARQARACTRDGDVLVAGSGRRVRARAPSATAVETKEERAASAALDPPSLVAH